MNKWVKALLILGGSIVVLWITGRLTGALQYYKIPTPSSEPNIHVGQKILVSNLKTPKRGDLIVYESALADSCVPGSETGEITRNKYIHRLCGMENDVIQMKEGIFFVNGKIFEPALNVYHFYTVPMQLKDSFIAEPGKEWNGPIFNEGNDSSFLMNLTSRQAAALAKGSPIRLYIDKNHDITFPCGVFKWYDPNLPWTADNFGPLTVPPGMYFVMGDNRNNSLDSRYTGFIKRSDIKGVKL
jgi:signal peptidase I